MANLMALIARTWIRAKIYIWSPLHFRLCFGNTSLVVGLFELIMPSVILTLSSLLLLSDVRIFPPIALQTNANKIVFSILKWGYGTIASYFQRVQLTPFLQCRRRMQWWQMWTYLKLIITLRGRAFLDSADRASERSVWTNPASCRTCSVPV
jgi:hypothetical protein